MEKLRHIIKFFFFVPRYLAMFVIKIYQKTISPDHGMISFLFNNGYCRYCPSCSQYGYEVIKKKGIIIGVSRTIWRIMRCNPWSKGGVDLP